MSEKVNMSLHTDDWCHLCGIRTEILLDIYYPKNAEHDTAQTEYIRICSECAELMTITMKKEVNDRINKLP